LSLTGFTIAISALRSLTKALECDRRWHSRTRRRCILIGWASPQNRHQTFLSFRTGGCQNRWYWL